jgi:hypothetical protein
LGGPPYFRSRRGCAQVEVVLGCVGFSSGREQRYFLVGLPVADADSWGRSGMISAVAVLVRSGSDFLTIFTFNVCHVRFNVCGC